MNAHERMEHLRAKWWRKLAIAQHTAIIALQRGGEPSPTVRGEIMEAERHLRDRGEL